MQFTPGRANFIVAPTVAVEGVTFTGRSRKTALLSSVPVQREELTELNQLIGKGAVRPLI